MENLPAIACTRVAFIPAPCRNDIVALRLPVAVQSIVKMAPSKIVSPSDGKLLCLLLGAIARVLMR